MSKNQLRFYSNLLPAKRIIRKEQADIFILNMSLTNGMKKLTFSRKEIWLLIIPMMIEQLFSYSVGFIDVLMVSSAGETALSAVNFANSINSLFITLFSSFAIGGGIIVAQYVGKDDNDSAKLASKQLLYIMCSLSFLFMIFALIFGKPILTFLYGNVAEELYSNIYTYYRVTALSYVFLAVYQGASAILRTVGNSRSTMTVSMLMNIFNITGNALLIYAFNLGILGAAISTLFSRILAAIIIILYLKSKKNPICLEKILRIRLSFPIIKNIIKFGVTSGISGIVTSTGSVFISNVLASLPVTEIAANSTVDGISYLMGIVNSSMGFAIVSIVSRCLGAGDVSQAKYYGIYFIKKSFFIGLILHCVILMLSPYIIGMFNLSNETADLALILLRCKLITNMILRPALLFGDIFKSGGDVKFVMTNTMINLWVIMVGGSYLLCYGFGMNIYAFYILEIVRFVYILITSYIRFKNGKWLCHKVI